MKDLRHLGLGFFCSTSDNRITTNRKFKLSNLTLSKFLNVFYQNLSDFVVLLEISKRMNLSIFRLGSNMVPFASHPNLDKSWLKMIEKDLKSSSEAIRKYGVRITMHPGQHVILSSPRKEVLNASLRELEYHFWLLDCLGVGNDSVVVVHVGGVYGDKRETLKRFIFVVRESSWLKERLAIENDERFYNLEDVLWLCERLNLPVVFDYYHHMINPSNFDSKMVLSSWEGRIPEFHLSSFPTVSKKLNEHGDWIEIEDVLSLENLFKGKRIDVILEAKKKEKAIERLIELSQDNGVVLSARSLMKG
ncbi:UV DNA damage repair endonuclease UvsE [Pseudothermotoga sp.]|uniref:UV DNA damage repair endonuclease UvsE n=1 Tax=Pseudothermotoga sp. TaxID=2033661 RepID=UPI0031F6D81A